MMSWTGPVQLPIGRPQQQLNDVGYFENLIFIQRNKQRSACALNSGCAAQRQPTPPGQTCGGNPSHSSASRLPAALIHAYKCVIYSSRSRSNPVLDYQMPALQISASVSIPSCPCMAGQATVDRGRDQQHNNNNLHGQCTSIVKSMPGIHTSCIHEHHSNPTNNQIVLPNPLPMQSSIEATANTAHVQRRQGTTQSTPQTAKQSPTGCYSVSKTQPLHKGR